jgi:hypothetical protein
MSSSVLMDDRLHHEVLELFTRLNICGSDNVRAEVRLMHICVERGEGRVMCI